MKTFTHEEKRLEQLKRLRLLGYCLIAFALFLAFWGFSSHFFINFFDMQLWKILCAKSDMEKEGFYAISFLLGFMGIYCISPFKK